MSKTSHTPGPFRVIDLRHQKNGQIRIISDAHLEGTNEICNVLARNQSAEANARLIAAAPELLEAALYSLDELKQYDNANEPGSAFEERREKAMNLLQLAIAKAEGK